MHPDRQPSVLNELLWYDERAVLQDTHDDVLRILRLIQEHYAGYARHDTVRRLQQNVINPVSEGEYEIAWFALTELIESQTNTPSAMHRAEQLLTALATYREYYNLP